MIGKWVGIDSVYIGGDVVVVVAASAVCTGTEGIADVVVVVAFKNISRRNVKCIVTTGGSLILFLFYFL